MKQMKHTITIEANPEAGILPMELTWTFEPVQEVKESKSLASQAKRTLTQAELVWEEVQLFYKQQGKSVPVDEAKACLADIKKEMEEQKKSWALIGSGISDAEYYTLVPPAYGTPEFWKAYQAKKKAAAASSKKP